MTKGKSPVVDFLAQIKDLEDSIKRSQHQIKILKTKRKLQVLEADGDLCSTCNGIMIYRYGHPNYPYFWVECEDCKQKMLRKGSADWSDDDPSTWPLTATATID